MSQSSEKPNKPAVIQCESVYKIFGTNASKLLENSTKI